MKKVVREALEQCITKYENMLAGTPTSLGPTECALCQLCDKDGYLECKPCPVAQRTGEGNCSGTPWVAICNTLPHDSRYGGRKFDNVVVRTAKLKAAVAAEIEFLKSLRPKQRGKK